MSKFFASGESDEDIESEEEEEEEEETRETMGGIAQNNRPTLVYSESESDSEDEKRVVRSVRDKRFDAILTPISQLKNHLKINDWVAISKDWDTIQKALEKAHILIAKEGIPPAFLGLLLFLEKKFKDLNDNKEAVKKLNGLNSKSYNTMKQKVKKELIKYSAKLEEYKKSPAATEETDDGNTEKKTEKKSEKKSPAKAKKTKADDEDDDDEEEEEESEEESEDKDDKKKAKKSVKKEESEEEDEDEDEESEEEESDDDKKKKKPAATKKKSGKKSESEEEDDDDEDDDEDEDEDESEEDESESSDEDEDLSLTSADKKSAYFTREFWVKKASTIEKERKKKEEEDKKRARKPQRGADSDEESEESGDEDDEDDEEESDRDHSEDEDIKRRKAREAKKKKEKTQRAEAEEKGEGKKEEKKEDVTPEAVLRKLRELLGQRGKRKTDRMALITHLRLLKARAEEAIIIAAKSGPKNAETTATASTGASLSAGTDAKQSEVELTPAAVLKISTTLVSCYFDISLNKTEAPYIPIPLWREAYSAVNDVLDQLEKTRLVRLSEDDKVDETFDEQLNEQLAIVGVANTNNNVAATPAPAVAEKKDKKNEVQFVHGSIISFVKLLHGEFRKSLLYIDHHSSEYVDRLRDEWKLVDLLQRAQSYYQRLNKPVLQAKCALAHLDLVHYHYTPAQDAVRNQLLTEQKQKEAADNTPAKANLPDASSEKIRSLASFIYHHGDDKSKVRAVLYEVYHLSMHNRWEDARDRFLSSHITDSAHALDVKTQILFNRVQAQLGLCAFRIGEYRRALHCLHDLFPAQINSPNAKELLAQGVAARFNQEQLSADELASLKRRMLPFHQHINIDTLEAVHLICAMIFEVPNMARFGSGNRKKVISRTFRRMLESHLRQAFNGPPENTRDRIMAATKALRQADHDRAFKFLSNLRMFDENLMPGGSIVRDFVLSKLKIKLQEDALKTWLLSYAHHYVSISVKELVEQFKLDGTVVRRLASKMMMNEELQGAWDEPTASIVMTSQQLTPLQRNVLGYAEKLNFLVEMNEKMSDPKQPFIPRPDWEKGGDRDRSDRPERAGERQYGGYQDGEQRNSNQNQSQWNAHSNRGYQQRGRRY